MEARYCYHSWQTAEADCAIDSCLLETFLDCGMEKHGKDKKVCSFFVLMPRSEMANSDRV